MPAIALIEPRTSHGQAAIATDIDAMCAVQIAVAAAQMAEGRTVDGDAALRRVAAQYAFFAVTEHAVGDGQVAAFQPDTRPVAIGNAQILKDNAIDAGRSAAQDQSCLALARHAIQDDGSGRARAKGNLSSVLHGALGVGARRDQHGPPPSTNRRDRILQRGIALTAFLHGKGGRSALRQSGSTDGGEDEQGRGQYTHGRRHRRAYRPGQCELVVNKMLFRDGTSSTVVMKEATRQISARHWVGGDAQPGYS